MKIIQISDTHFFADKKQGLWDNNPYENCSRVIAAIKKDLPDMLLISGDLSQDDTIDSYKTLAELVGTLEVPVYFVPGNHDIPAVLQDSFQGKNIKADKLVYLQDWALILLDSSRENWVAGYLSGEQLRFLRESLERTPNHSVMIAMHHHPVPINSPLMDQYILQNSEEFLKIVEEFSQVKLVLFGHVHQVADLRYHRVPFLGCPSTFVQFMPHATTLVLDNENPGYRWIDLKKENFHTGICRVE